MGSAPRILPAPSASPLPPDDYFSINTTFCENVIGKPEKVIENIDNALNAVPEPPEIELGDSLINKILQDDYINDNVLIEETIEEIKDGYNFHQIKDAFDEGKVPPQLEFFFGKDNENFVNACNLIGPDEENNEFVSFLWSDMGQNLMTDNSLSIHIESGNIFMTIITQMKISIIFY